MKHADRGGKLQKPEAQTPFSSLFYQAFYHSGVILKVINSMQWYSTIILKQQLFYKLKMVITFLIKSFVLILRKISKGLWRDISVFKNTVFQEDPGLILSAHV